MASSILFKCFGLLNSPLKIDNKSENPGAFGLFIFKIKNFGAVDLWTLMSDTNSVFDAEIFLIYPKCWR